MLAVKSVHFTAVRFIAYSILLPRRGTVLLKSSCSGGNCKSRCHMDRTSMPIDRVLRPVLRQISTGMQVTGSARTDLNVCLN